MAANVETMFSVREKPWHGLGMIVSDAPTSADALRMAGLDWEVLQESIYTDAGNKISGYKKRVSVSEKIVLKHSTVCFETIRVLLIAKC